jgi:hypothetical protein
MNWKEWHSQYDRCEVMQSRLATVRQTIEQCLRLLPPGRQRILSVCAGDGRDIIPLIAQSPRRSDFRGVLVEQDAALVKAGQELIDAHELGRYLTFLQADATAPAIYAERIPCDLVLAAGVFGNLLPRDFDMFVRALGAFLKTDGYLVWTRNRVVSNGHREIPRIRQTLQSHGFVECYHHDITDYIVACHQYQHETLPLPDTKLFTFTPFSEIPARRAPGANLLRSLLQWLGQRTTA